ncbi:hypothetical protein [Leptospira noguchii]|nr:hypothetical protein [Leptospira noguchii]
MKFASCDDDPQGVVALSLLFAPIFLRRTHVNKNRNFRICP